MTGSSLPWRASSVRSRPYSSSVFVVLAGRPPASPLSTPRMTAPRSFVCVIAEPLEQLARLGLGVLRQREQHVLGPHVRRADLARLLVGGQQGGLRVRRQRRRHVRALLDRLLPPRSAPRSRRDRHRPAAARAGRPRPGSRPRAGGRVDVQAPPLHRLLGGALEQLAGGVAEVLGDVDLLGRAARPRGGHATAVAGRAAAEGAVAEEVGEELVEEAAPATEGRPRRSARL